MSAGGGSRNSLSKAQMRPGDFHLRGDARRMFGNYVEVSSGGGNVGALARVRRNASVVETPVYDEPRLWRISALFSRPYATVAHPVAAPLTPWVPEGIDFGIKLTVRTAFDRDKAVSEQSQTLDALDTLTPFNAFSDRYTEGLQVGVKVETIGDTTAQAVLGVQISITPVEGGARDGYGNAVMQQFAASDASQLFLPENARRRQFFVQNMAESPLYLAFGELAVGPGGGGPQWTVALLNVGDIYESPRDCWLGAVAGIWASDAASADEVAVVTEGT